MPKKNKTLCVDDLRHAEYLSLIHIQMCIRDSSHSDYVGGMKETTLKEMMAKKPEKVVELAVKGMLPNCLLYTSTRKAGSREKSCAMR